MDDDFEDSIGYEDEIYHCKKCGKEIIRRIQDTENRGDGEFDFDPEEGKCEICYAVYCGKCGGWNTFGGKYRRICGTCFNEKILAIFSEFYDVFNDGYCNNQCDDCLFFFKKGCIIKLLNELLDITFHTQELKQVEIQRIQRRNREAEKNWKERLNKAMYMAKEIIGKGQGGI
jgi:hypothetical protein